MSLLDPSMELLLINRLPHQEADLRCEGKVVFERDLGSFFNALTGEFHLEPKLCSFV